MGKINIRHDPQIHTDMASDARGLEHQNKKTRCQCGKYTHLFPELLCPGSSSSDSGSSHCPSANVWLLSLYCSFALSFTQLSRIILKMKLNGHLLRLYINCAQTRSCALQVFLKSLGTSFNKMRDGIRVGQFKVVKCFHSCCAPFYFKHYLQAFQPLFLKKVDMEKFKVIANGSNQHHDSKTLRVNN